MSGNHVHSVGQARAVGWSARGTQPSSVTFPPKHPKQLSRVHPFFCPLSKNSGLWTGTQWKDSEYNGDYRVGLQTGDNPFVQSAYGSMVTPETIALIDAAKASFVAGGSPFSGPVMNQDGETVWAEGETPTYADIEQMDFFVQGVIGSTG